jgi:8-oxo-dGTP diphosphatase
MPGELVVGAAILREGRVLAARRVRPAAAAGRWELPGGKVEPGETPEDALVREVAEELGCAIAVDGWLAGESPLADALVLVVARAALVEGDPVPHEHDAVRWLGPDELDDVDWLDADRPFLAELRDLLSERVRR